MKRQNVLPVIAVVLGTAAITFVVAMVMYNKVIDGLEQTVQTMTAQRTTDSTQIANLQFELELKESVRVGLVKQLDSSSRHVVALQDTLQAAQATLRQTKISYEQRMADLEQRWLMWDTLYHASERSWQLAAQQLEESWQQRYDTLCCSHEQLSEEFRGLLPWYRYLYLDYQRGTFSHIVGSHRPPRPTGTMPKPDSLAIPR